MVTECIRLLIRLSLRRAGLLHVQLSLFPVPVASACCVKKKRPRKKGSCVVFLARGIFKERCLLRDQMVFQTHQKHHAVFHSLAGTLQWWHGTKLVSSAMASQQNSIAPYHSVPKWFTRNPAESASFSGYWPHSRAPRPSFVHVLRMTQVFTVHWENDYCCHNTPTHSAVAGHCCLRNGPQIHWKACLCFSF